MRCPRTLYLLPHKDERKLLIHTDDHNRATAVDSCARCFRIRQTVEMERLGVNWSPIPYRYEYKPVVISNTHRAGDGWT